MRGNNTGPAEATIPAPAYDLSYTPRNCATMLAWIWTISPTMLNDVRVNATRWAYNTLNSTSIDWGIPAVYVQNMPGAVGRTSTYALTNVTLPYVRQLAKKGLERAIADNPGLRQGVNVRQGKVTNPAVAETFGLECVPPAG